jgi:AcrR family transcriptional regulator
VPESSPTRDEERRSRILETARSLCERSGFDAVRMEAIAAEARVSKGSLYRFFASKEDLLLQSLIDSHMRESYTLADLPRPGLEPGEPGSEDRLANLLEEYARSMPEATERMPVNLQVWGLAAGSGRRETLHQALRETAYPFRADALSEALRAGMRAGVYRADVDLEAFVATLIAVFDGLLYRSTFDPTRAHPDQLRHSFGLLLDSIRATGDDGSRAPAENEHGG